MKTNAYLQHNWGAPSKKTRGVFHRNTQSFDLKLWDIDLLLWFLDDVLWALFSSSSRPQVLMNSSPRGDRLKWNIFNNKNQSHSPHECSISAKTCSLPWSTHRERGGLYSSPLGRSLQILNKLLLLCCYEFILFRVQHSFQGQINFLSDFIPPKKSVHALFWLFTPIDWLFY